MEHTQNTSITNSTSTQWHPAFFSSLQIEFENEADKLIFENEHLLSTKPMAIDVLIIKKYLMNQSRKILDAFFENIILLNTKVLMII